MVSVYFSSINNCVPILSYDFQPILCMHSAPVSTHRCYDRVQWVSNRMHNTAFNRYLCVKVTWNHESMSRYFNEKYINRQRSLAPQLMKFKYNAEHPWHFHPKIDMGWLFLRLGHNIFQEYEPVECRTSGGTSTLLPNFIGVVATRMQIADAVSVACK